MEADIVVEQVNRVGAFYPELILTNAFNYTRPTDQDYSLLIIGITRMVGIATHIKIDFPHPAT